MLLKISNNRRLADEHAHGRLAGQESSGTKSAHAPHREKQSRGAVFARFTRTRTLELISKYQERRLAHLAPCGRCAVQGTAAQFADGRCRGTPRKERDGMLFCAARIPHHVSGAGATSASPHASRHRGFVQGGAGSYLLEHLDVAGQTRHDVEHHAELFVSPRTACGVP